MEKFDYEKRKTEAVLSNFSAAFQINMESNQYNHLVLELIMCGKSPYEILESLCDSMLERDKAFKDYIAVNGKPTPIIVDYNTLPDNLKAAYNKI